MLLIFATFSLVVTAVIANDASLNRSDLMCSGTPHHNVTMTSYYPDYTSDDESDYLDVKGKKLRTLQDFIDDRAEFVTVAMDLPWGIPYGAPICVPELNDHFRRRIRLQARDFGSHLRGKKYSRVDVCVRSEADTYDQGVNRLVTVYV